MKGDEQLFKLLVPKPRVAVARQPPQVGSPHRIRLTDQPIIPADNAAGGCGDRGLVPENLASLATRPAVSDGILAFKHPAEQVGYMPDLLLPSDQVSSNGCPEIPDTRASRSASIMWWRSSQDS